MTGHDRARRILGVWSPIRGQPKMWDYPESAQALQLFTGLDWRELNLRPRQMSWFSRIVPAPPEGEWVPVPQEFQHAIWERAWATRQHGWLIIAGADEPAGDIWVLSPKWLSAPELDRSSAERLARTLWDTIGVGALVTETDVPELPYVVWVSLRSGLGIQEGLGAHPEDFTPEAFLWEVRLMLWVAQRLSEVRQ